GTSATGSGKASCNWDKSGFSLSPFRSAGKAPTPPARPRRQAARTDRRMACPEQTAPHRAQPPDRRHIGAKARLHRSHWHSLKVRHRETGGLSPRESRAPAAKPPRGRSRREYGRRARMPGRYLPPAQSEPSRRDPQGERSCAASPPAGPRWWRYAAPRRRRRSDVESRRPSYAYSTHQNAFDKLDFALHFVPDPVAASRMAHALFFP